MKHTELPLDLHVEGRKICCSSYPRIVGEIEIHSTQDIDRAEELAAFFVKAARTYGPMVEALRTAENMLKIHSGCNCADCNDGLKQVRSALAQLPSESEV